MVLPAITLAFTVVVRTLLHQEKSLKGFIKPRTSGALRKTTCFIKFQLLLLFEPVLVFGWTSVPRVEFSGFLAEI